MNRAALVGDRTRLIAQALAETRIESASPMLARTRYAAAAADRGRPDRDGLIDSDLQVVNIREP